MMMDAACGLNPALVLGKCGIGFFSTPSVHSPSSLNIAGRAPF